MARCASGLSRFRSIHSSIELGSKAAVPLTQEAYQKTCVGPTRQSAVINLYHGTLARNVTSIRKLGLLPKKGRWVSNFQPSASELVYAVDDEHCGRLVTYITGQIAKFALVEPTEDYAFDDFKNDLIELSAIIVIKSERFCQYPSHYLSGHKSGPEPGDWYSHEPVRADEIEAIVTGQKVLDWLQPGEPDFVYRLRDILRRG